MADTIKLPPLPPYVRSRLASAGMLTEVLARDIAVARAVLEAAGRRCDHWATQDWVHINGAIRCGKDIRAMKIKGEA